MLMVSIFFISVDNWEYNSKWSKNLKTNGPARWFQSGYRKKTRCELCGFKAVNEQQMDVFHVDGNRNNTSVYNLKTICANCQRLKSTQDLGWSIGDLEVDA